MAQRRMFSLQIVDTDAFIDMPQSSQLLYFHLAMRADDDGFVNNPKKIMKMVGIQDDDLKVLIAKRFILTFESGVVVIKHWKIHNYIQNDRYKETNYTDEKKSLILKENGSYTECIQDVSKMDTQVRLGKDRLELGKVRESRNFVPPSLNELSEYISTNGYNVDPETFMAFYESNGWKVGKNKMVSWKGAVATWQKRNGTKDKFIAFEEMLTKYLKPNAPPEKWNWQGISLWKMKLVINECYPDNMGMATPEDINNLNKVVENVDKIKKHLM